MLLFVCLFVIARGCDRPAPYRSGGRGGSSGTIGSDDPDVWNMEHPYLLAMKNDQGQMFYRIRGLGLINDPNDFGQLLVCVTPLLFIFWRAKKMILNIAFVILPACVLLIGVYLTHSRGALLALMAMAIVAARRRIGTRARAGAGGRALCWGHGPEFYRRARHFSRIGRRPHGALGRGTGNLQGASAVRGGLRKHGRITPTTHQTAHNSLVVCAAELGLFGLYFWSLVPVPHRKRRAGGCFADEGDGRRAHRA